MFDTKNPTVLLLGRWQPWHDGHLALFKRAISKTGQVRIQKVKETKKSRRTMKIQEAVVIERINHFESQNVFNNSYRFISSFSKRFLFFSSLIVVILSHILSWCPEPDLNRHEVAFEGF